MPDNTNAAIAFFAAFHFASPVSARCFGHAIFGCRAKGFIDRCLYGKELMITGDDFVRCAAIRIVFEDPADWQWALDIWRSLKPG